MAALDVDPGYEVSDYERYAPESGKTSSRSEFERDLGRMWHSAALRRLGAKTQVMGPESDDFVRTRLTHSLEVAQIGRYLAKVLGANQDVVQAACLAHDMGHPPFGHNGERALAQAAAQIGSFEGNAQTLRLVTRLEAKRMLSADRSEEGKLRGSSAATDPAADDAPSLFPLHSSYRGDAPAAGMRQVGMNLTRAVIDAMIKYPWKYGENPAGTNPKKFNVYEDDEPIFRFAHGSHGSRRCAEAQMMDLADDIAYSVNDVEDAVVRGFVDPAQLCRAEEQDRIIEATAQWYRVPDADALQGAFDRLLRLDGWPDHFCGSYADLAAMKNLTSRIIGRFIDSVVDATRDTVGDIPVARYQADLVIPPQTQEEILVMKGIAVEYVMEPREHQPLSAAQRAMLFDLVDVLSSHPEHMERMFIDMYHEATDDAARLRVVIDQVASLTDQSARAWHSRFVGMLHH
ncbi:MAG: deoxyguanosinetriphosphate triphosphohydrolase [Actinomycetaceae bacterium]|nr:deoxyguanosinetriphosphate triphosphohydrolase [Actinomycetaceae bacterium]MDY6083055.1 deoxyguanosinetriphosphate triphosphohydrolase [Actinomycetaceae bacterium]